MNPTDQIGTEASQEFVDRIEKAKQEGQGASQEDAAKQKEDAILNEQILIHSVALLTPISPVTYKVQARTIEKVIRHVWGITQTSEVIGVKTIDQVNIAEGIFFGSVNIIHEDKSTITLDKISKADARKVKAFYETIVEYQRKNVVNITGD